MVPESNQKMKDSYLILDENLCFLNCLDGKKTPSQSLLKVSVDVALKEAGFDAKMFEERGGLYDWTRPRQVPEGLPKQSPATSKPSSATAWLLLCTWVGKLDSSSAADKDQAQLVVGISLAGGLLLAASLLNLFTRCQRA